MKILYINDLRGLPNFGCRTTGAALEQLLSVHHKVWRRDGLETVAWSGWDPYALDPIRMGGVLPGRVYFRAWPRRYTKPKFFEMARQLDTLFGARHDFIADDPQESVHNFLVFARTNAKASEMLAQLRAVDALVVNGEGTLIFSTPMKRDASYILFALALAEAEGKGAYLLNAMVTPDPFTGADPKIIGSARPILAACSRIACREQESYEYVASLVGENALTQIPDALFTWGPRFREAAVTVRKAPLMAVSYRSSLNYDELDLDAPYICVSGTSSAWRHGHSAVEQYARLGTALAALGMRVYFVETCDGDSYLRAAGRSAGITLIPKETPVMAAGGILAGAEAYIAGRYHPAIMAASTGVPTVFLASNSHKTRSIQALLGYENPMEFSACPTDLEIASIVQRTEWALVNRRHLADRIRKKADEQAVLAQAYTELLQPDHR